MNGPLPCKNPLQPGQMVATSGAMARLTLRQSFAIIAGKLLQCITNTPQSNLKKQGYTVDIGEVSIQQKIQI